MSCVRFATAEALFETFPELCKQIGTKPSDESPIDFLKGLVSQGNIRDAVTFCAHMLPRREAVWWACGCARALLGDIPNGRAASLLAAEAWVGEPDDAHRRAALEVGTEANCDDPLTWLALAAGWAGGFFVSNPTIRVPMPIFMTARAARIAVILGATKIPEAQRQTRLEACVADGIKLAETGL